jgi:HK97 family phage prohead protease
MSATQTRNLKLWHNANTSLQVRADAELPPGIAGRVSGIAVTYDVVDSYGTMFARGCAKRSIDQRVAARKVPLLMDHEASTRAHVGVVSAMSEAGDALIMTADVFDTEEGRAAMEYVKAVMAAGASTGFSIGFVPRKAEIVNVDGSNVERFTEIELREVSITPMPAVPGASVTSARHEERTDDMDEDDVMEETDPMRVLMLAARMALDALSPEMRAALLADYLTPLSTPTQEAAPVPVTDTLTAPVSNESRGVAMEDRIKAVRQSFITPCL